MPRWSCAEGGEASVAALSQNNSEQSNLHDSSFETSMRLYIIHTRRVKGVVVNYYTKIVVRAKVFGTCGGLGNYIPHTYFPILAENALVILEHGSITCTDRTAF